MKSVLMTLFICTAVVLFAFFGFEAWSDRKAVQQAVEVCAANGVYDVDTTGFGAWISCNDPQDLEPAAVIEVEPLGTEDTTEGPDEGSEVESSE